MQVYLKSFVDALKFYSMGISTLIQALVGTSYDLLSFSVAQSLSNALIQAGAGTSYALLTFDNQESSVEMVSNKIIEEKPRIVVYMVRKPRDLDALHEVGFLWHGIRSFPKLCRETEGTSRCT
jgi:hypothetical protein